MQIMVLADAVIEQEFRNKKLNQGIKVIFIENQSSLLNNEINYDNIDSFFLLEEAINKDTYRVFGTKPVFINSTIHTLSELDLPGNFNRINGWSTFINRDIWEIATSHKEIVNTIFQKMGWKYITVADEPGLVSARIISMIINEAYFALGEGVSSKDEIDIAMKLGTNYPYGPFEWAKKIGLKKVYSLLQKLSETNNSYTIAPEMKNELLTD
jgi:3-hydroxybutyryl-CoA dehydrogenase